VVFNFQKEYRMKFPDAQAAMQAAYNPGFPDGYPPVVGHPAPETARQPFTAEVDAVVLAGVGLGHAVAQRAEYHQLDETGAV
jgi:hypothetical protein